MPKEQMALRPTEVQPEPVQLASSAALTVVQKLPEQLAALPTLTAEQNNPVQAAS